MALIAKFLLISLILFPGAVGNQSPAPMDPPLRLESLSSPEREILEPVNVWDRGWAVSDDY